jgi:hypothetical protein
LWTTGFLAALVFSTAVSGDETWGNYHWPRAKNPGRVVLGDNVDARWDPWLRQASSDWSTPVVETKIARGLAQDNCVPPDGRVEVCNDGYGFNGWLGLAQLWLSGDHIISAAIKLNDSYHDLYPYKQEGWRDFVMCQEVGHTLGLGHRDENFENDNLGTCMDYTDNPDGPPSNRQPDAQDYSTLDALYSHTDGGGRGGHECDGSWWKCAGGMRPPAAFHMELSRRGQWGRLVSRSRDGGQSLFMQDFGNGYQVFTHVTWALEVAGQSGPL